MRCKILDVGPMDGFHKAIKRFRGKRGTFHRVGAIPREWLSGDFVFDDPKQCTLFFHQLRVEPLNE